MEWLFNAPGKTEAMLAQSKLLLSYVTLTFTIMFLFSRAKNFQSMLNSDIRITKDSSFQYLSVARHRWFHNFSRFSLCRSPRDCLKYFEISVPRHIRDSLIYYAISVPRHTDVSDLQNWAKINETTTYSYHKWICNLTPEIRYILKILWKIGEIAPKEQFLLFFTIFYYLLLDFHA